MNDSELDEILNQWRAPSAPSSMRERLYADSPLVSSENCPGARASLRQPFSPPPCFS